MDSRTKKILISILAVIGAGLLLVAAAIIGFIVWLRSPTPMLDTARLLDPGTTGYAILAIDPEDAETIAFLEAFESEFTAVAREGGVRMPFGMTPRANFDSLVPSELAWTMYPAGNGDGDLHLVSISLPRIGRWISIGDSVMGWFTGGEGDNTRAEIYGDERIVPVESGDFGGAYFLRSGTIFVTSSVETARMAIDRLSAEDAPATGGPNPLEGLLEQADAEAPIRGAVTNSRGELSRVLNMVRAFLEREPFEGAFDLSRASGIFLDARFSGTGGIEGTASLARTNAPWSDAETRALADWLGQFGPDDLRGAELELDVRSDGELLEIGFRVPNLVEVLAVGLPVPPTGRPQER